MFFRPVVLKSTGRRHVTIAYRLWQPSDTPSSVQIAACATWSSQRFQVDMLGMK